jgi:hypothetical protein
MPQRPSAPPCTCQSRTGTWPPSSAGRALLSLASTAQVQTHVGARGCGHVGSYSRMLGARGRLYPMSPWLPVGLRGFAELDQQL